jgi:glycosyltransferase involved in cell wall biosynthesis
MEQKPESQKILPMERSVPKVSIGMPVYNGEKYIRQAIDSVISQTFTDFELVISDNASTDGTEAICREFAKRDSRIRYIRQKENIGAINNFNFLLKRASSTYFSWISHDDYLENTYVEVMARYLDEHSDVVLCVGDLNVVKNGIKVDAIIHHQIRDTLDWEHARRKFFTYSHNIVMPIFGLFRLDLMRTHNIYIEPGFRGKVFYGLERSILPKVALQGKIVALPKLLFNKRIHDEALSHNEPNQITRLHLFMNVLYIIVKYQASVALFSKLTARQKLLIFFEMFSYNVPIILSYAWECVPPKLYRWFTNMRLFQPMRDRMRLALLKRR